MTITFNQKYQEKPHVIHFIYLENLNSTGFLKNHYFKSHQKFQHWYENDLG